MRAMTRNIQFYCSGLTVLVTAVMVIVAMVIVVVLGGDGGGDYDISGCGNGDCSNGDCGSGGL